MSINDCIQDFKYIAKIRRIFVILWIEIQSYIFGRNYNVIRKIVYDN